MSYDLWKPALVFSAHNSELKLQEAKVRTAGIINAFASVPKWVLGNVGVPIIFGESISWLIRFTANVEESQEKLIEAKIEKANVTLAISLYRAEIKAIRGRLDRLFRNIPRRERELEVVPAFMSCQKILALFQDENYPFHLKPEISSPLLLSFAGFMWPCVK